MPRLFAAFRRHGMPRKSLWRAVFAWAWLVYRAPWAAVSVTWRDNWVQVASGVRVCSQEVSGTGYCISDIGTEPGLRRGAAEGDP